MNLEEYPYYIIGEEKDTSNIIILYSKNQINAKDTGKGYYIHNITATGFKFTINSVGEISSKYLNSSAARNMYRTK